MYHSASHSPTEGHLCCSQVWNFFFFRFSGLQVQYVEVPRLGVKLELQLLADAAQGNARSLTH